MDPTFIVAITGSVLLTYFGLRFPLGLVLWAKRFMSKK